MTGPCKLFESQESCALEARDFPRAVYRNFLQFQLTLSQAAAGVELNVATSDVAYACAELWFDPRGDANWAGAVFKIYAIVKDVRVLRGSFTLTDTTNPQRVLQVAGGADAWEATVAPPLVPNPATKFPFILVTYGDDQASVVTLAGDVIGASNANVVSTITGVGGKVVVNGATHLEFGTSSFMATSGFLRWPDTGNALVTYLATHDNTTINMPIVTINTRTYNMVIGDVATAGTAWGQITIGASIMDLKASQYFLANAGNAIDYIEVDVTGTHIAASPLMGSSLSQKVWALGEATIPMGDANQTPAAAVYQMPHLILTGAATANHDLNLPATTGGTVFVDNQCTGAFSVNVKVSGQTGFPVANGKKAIGKLNSAHTDWTRFTPDT